MEKKPRKSIHVADAYGYKIMISPECQEQMEKEFPDENERKKALDECITQIASRIRERK